MAFTIIIEPSGIRLVCEGPLTAADAVRTTGLFLDSTVQRPRAKTPAALIEYLELTLAPGFNRYFAQGARLPVL